LAPITLGHPYYILIIYAMKMPKNYFFKNKVNITIFIITLAGTFVILEIGLRLLYGNNPFFLWPQVQHVRTEYGYKLKPNQRDVYTLDKRVYTNSFGFRDGEWKQPKGSGVIRIILNSRFIVTRLVE